MEVKFQDYYQTLGVERSASQDEINKAFRKLARKYHPDVSKEPDAEEQFKLLNEAYEVLKDPEKRKKYDELGANWQAGQDFTPPPGWENVHFEFRQGPEDFADFGHGGFSSFFDMLFGHRQEGFQAGPRTAQTRQWSFRGQDHEATLTISLEEAYRGGSKTVTLQTPERRPDGPGQAQSKQYQVKIPAGITPGARIRLAKQGGAGSGGGESGDLFLRVRITPHPVFTLEGRDVLVSIPITPWEAALGAKIEVPTLDGAVQMSVPPGSQSGQRLRLRGKGFLRDGGERGDLYVTLQIVVPKTLSTDERQLFEQLASQSSFHPREQQ
jgi:curved DNA-binding protein